MTSERTVEPSRGTICVCGLAKSYHPRLAGHEYEPRYPARRAATPAPRGDGWEELRRLAEAATPGPWRSRKGYGPDKFAPKGYRYVLFGPGREEMYGTDQLKPEDADFIVTAVNFVRDRLAAARGEPEPQECSTCGGHGWVAGIGADPLPSGEPGEPYQVQETCPDCGGAGFLAARGEPELGPNQLQAKLTRHHRHDHVTATTCRVCQP